MKIYVFYLRVICTCDQCDSPFCALQLTALIKPNWCVLLYCCASLCHSLIVVQPSWNAVPCPTKLGLLISKPFVGIRQSVIGVVLKIPLKNKIGNLLFTKIHFRVGLLTILVLHQAAPPPHFTTNLRPWVAHTYKLCHKPGVTELRLAIRMRLFEPLHAAL